MKQLIDKIKASNVTPEDIKACSIEQLTSAGSNGNTALHVACKYNNLTVIEAIIERLGPKKVAELAFLENKEKETPIDIADDCGSEAGRKLFSLLTGDKLAEIIGITELKWGDIFFTLINEPEESTTTTTKLNKDKEETARIIALSNSAGISMLHFAAKGYPRVVPLILSVLDTSTAGALNLLNKNGNTPLHLATRYQPDAVQPLLATLGDSAAAAANNPNNNGFTPLHLAADFQPAAVPQLIKALGESAAAAVNNLNNDGLTPLHLAILYQPAAVPPLLAALGDSAAANYQNKNGWTTPLRLAAVYQPDAVQPLIEVLGIDNAIKQLTNKKCSLISVQEKKAISTVITTIMRDRLFPKLIKENELTEIQHALCLKYKNKLKDFLLTQYGQNAQKLIRSINKETPLGKIFWHTTTRANIGLFGSSENIEPKIVRGIKKLINNLLRTNKHDLDTPAFCSIPDGDQQQYYHQEEDGSYMEVTRIEITREDNKDIQHTIFIFPKDDPQKRHFMEFNEEHKLIATHLRTGNSEKLVFDKDEYAEREMWRTYQSEMSGLRPNETQKEFIEACHPAASLELRAPSL